MMILSSGWAERRLSRGMLPFAQVHDYLSFFHIVENRKEIKEAPGQIVSEDLPTFTDFIAQLSPPVMVLIGRDWLEFHFRLNLLGNLGAVLDTYAYWLTELRA